jgi:hypothetical protein
MGIGVTEMKMSRIPLLVLGLLLVCGGPVGATDDTSCVACHGDTDLFDGDQLEIVELWRDGVHAEAELGCHDCHGGNSDPALAEDSEAAMDPGYRENPYVGVPDRTAIPSFCGRCHSDPNFMKRFSPGARVDQESEYWTSHHGRALREGDTRVATCVDCHGAHSILRAGDTRSPVYPKLVADTCGRCHSDPELMAGSQLPDGRPVPVDQEARWRRSVHAQTMYGRDDLSAPTCNDCHGNHGATPPGLESIAFVCGQCHGREAGLFRASAKQDGLLDHNELLGDAGDEACAACHEAPEPASSVSGVHAFTECSTCHGNHAVIRPSVALLEPLPVTPCAFCHEPLGPLAEVVQEPERRQRSYQQVLESILLETTGLEGEALYNELVGRALELEHHTVPGGAADGSGRALRPEVDRLFTKFRIGTTTFYYTDPITGQEVEERVVRCGDCHAAEPFLADDPQGLTTSRELLERMRELTALTARAERIALTARRGGVEARDALSHIDQAVDAQIGLEVLVHGFSPAEGSEFATKQAEGLEHARAALLAGQEGLDQLRFRRIGLAISLVFIVLVLIGIAMKIRQLGSG